MTRSSSRLAGLVLAVTGLLIAVPAQAQQVRPRPATPPEQWYVTGAAGTSLDSPRSANYGVEIGESLGRIVQAYVNVAYFDDVMSTSSRDQLSALGSTLTFATGTPWSFTGRDRGRAVTAGARALVPIGIVRPFAGAGVGALNVERIIIERTRGDMTQQLAEQFGSLGDVTVNPSSSSATHPIWEGIAGVSAVVGRLHVEGTYRYRRPFHDLDGLHISQAGIAAGVSF